MILFFDLPVITLQNRREYTRFHKFLQKNGFIMLQESVYSKMVLNQTVLHSVTEKVRKNKPSSGKIQVLTVTEKQYTRMEYILGDFDGDVITSDERLIVL